MTCSIKLTLEQQIALSDELNWSPFKASLEDYYQGRGSVPDISLLSDFILEEVIPGYYTQGFSPKELVAFLADPTNGGAIKSAIQQLIGSALLFDTGNVPPVSYTSPLFDVFGSIYGDAVAKLEAVEETAEEIVQEVENKDIVSPDEPMDTRNAIFKNRYSDKQSYKRGRFKASNLTETMFINKFRNEFFLKAVYYDTDKRTIVNQLQEPGQPFEVDINLKTKRIELLEKMIQSLDLKEIVNGVAVPVEFNEESLTPKRFDAILTLIEDKVINVKYNGDIQSLENQGVLFEITNRFTKSADPELGKIVNDYINYVILADYDKIIEYYFPEIISIAKRVGDFDMSLRKYSTVDITSTDAINSKWDEKIQDGIKNMDELYKMIINSTPMLSYVTGLPVKGTLYPALVQEVYSKYFPRIDFNNSVQSIKDLLIEGLEDPNNSYTTKNVLYTMYKNFFEEDGDVLTFHPNNIEADSAKRNVRSLLATVKANQTNNNHPLMLVITKPLEEVSKVLYAEAMETRRNNPAIVYAATNTNTVTKTLVQRDFENHINRPADVLQAVIDKFNIRGGANTSIDGDLNFQYNNTQYRLSAKRGEIKADLESIIALSDAILGLDFINNSVHVEFFEELKAMSVDGQFVPASYLQFLRQAGKMMLAKHALADPKIKNIISEGKGLTKNKILDKLVEAKDKSLNLKNLDDAMLTLSTPVAHDMYDLSAQSVNRFTGNRLKSTVNTLEGTTVAGFSQYNYFLGIKNNWAKIRQYNASIVAPQNNVLARNPFINDGELLKNFYVRGAVKVGDKVKSNSEHTVLETLHYDINLGYFGLIERAYSDNRLSTLAPIFDPTTYSDKTTNFLAAVNNTYVSPNRGSINLFVDEQGKAVAENTTLQLAFDSNKSYYTALANNIADTWNEIYKAAGLGQIIGSGLTPSEKLAYLNIINAFTSVDESGNAIPGFWYTDNHPFGLKGYAAARYYADKAGVHLTNWIHYQNNGKTINHAKIPLSVKNELISYVALFDKGNNMAAFKARLDNVMLDTVNDMLTAGFKFLPDASSAINRMYPDLPSRFTTSDRSMVHLSQGASKKVTSISQINPAFRKFFYDWNFVSESLMSATLGNIYAHKGKTENNMWVTKVKRNVAAGASMRRYTLGLEQGIEDFTRTAFVDDIATMLKTIHGEEHQVVDLDGGALCTYTQRIKTWNSLNSKFSDWAGLDHKPFTTHFDPSTGEVGINKFADFTMTNDLIRNSIGSDIDLLELHKKLYATDISKFNITQSWKDEVNLTDFTDVYRWDRDYDFAKGSAGTIYKLESIKYAGKDVSGNNQYVVTETNQTTGDRESAIVNISTMYDLWQVLGGIDSVSLSEEKTAITVGEGNETVYFKGSHTSAIKLLDFESYMGEKNEFILPETYIPQASNQHADAYKTYKSVFKTAGIVNTHLELVNKIVNNAYNATEEDLQAIGLVNVDPIMFNAKIKVNRKELKNLISYVVNDDSNPSKYFKWMNNKYQPFKGKNIERLTTAGAQKVGQFNINDSSTFSNSRRYKALLTIDTSQGTSIPGVTEFITHLVNNTNSGVQLSAFHETEESTVTLPTQMFNAFAFKGYSLEDVDEIYNAIANIVEEGLTDVFFRGTKDHTSVNIPSVVRSLQGDTYEQAKDTMLKVFREIMLAKMKKGADMTLEGLILEVFDYLSLPIDDTHMFSSAVAELTNYFTKKGIKTNFDGMFAVLSPGSGMQQFRDIKGGFMPVKLGNKITYKPVNGVMVVNAEEYRQWKRLNEYLGTNESELEESTPRDLKGQQVILEKADGTKIALSILKSGETHLIPEAQALGSVKEVIDAFKAKLSSGEYELATEEMKMDFTIQYKNEFKEAINNLLSSDKKVSAFYNRFFNRIGESIDVSNIDDSLDWLYDNLSNTKTDRDKKVDTLTSQDDLSPEDLRAWRLAEEYEFLDRMNVVGKLFTYELQSFMQDVGNNLHPESITSSEIYEGPLLEEGDKLTVSRAEVVAPVTMKKAFLLREGDNLNDVSEEFFVNRILEEQEYLDNHNSDLVIAASSGHKYFLHKGSAPDGVKKWSNMKVENGRQWFTVGDVPVFALPKDVFVTEIKGEIHVYLNDKYNVLNNSIIDNITRYFETQRKISVDVTPTLKDEESRIFAAAERYTDALERAQEMFNSWNKYLDIIGTRIPGQHFQSFQGLRIVSFTEGNKIYVPNEITLLSGSDFDIDKQNIIYYSITSEGKIASWHPAFDLRTKENLDLSLRLPLPSNRQYAYFASEIDATMKPLDDLVEVVDSTTLEGLVNIYDQLKRGLKLDPNVHADLIERLIELDNTKRNPVSVNGIKNFAISRANKIIEYASNFLLLYKPVTMDTPKMFGDNSPKGEASKNQVRENPMSIAQAKYNNMVGKKVIGIMAAGGLKSLSAMTMTYNNSLKDLSNILRKVDMINESIETVDKLTDNAKHTALTKQLAHYVSEANYIKAGLLGKVTVANLRYENLQPSITKHIKLHPSYNALAKLWSQGVEDLTSTETINGSLDLLKIRAEFDEDAAELLSQLLSAATDNAKELILAKINATPELAGVFAAMIIQNYSFERIVDIMTSPVVEMIIRNAGRNIFDNSTMFNSLDNLVALVTRITDTDQASRKQENKESLLYSYNMTVRTSDSATYLIDDTTKEVFNLEDLKFMQTLYERSNDLKLLSKYLGINQGIKSNSWDLYKFKTAIEDYVNKYLGSKVFSFKRFIDSLEAGEVYHRDMIMQLSTQLEAAGASFNVLYILASTPNFAKQLVAYNAANTMLTMSSYKVNSVYNIVDKLKEERYLSEHRAINEQQFRQIEKFIEESVLDNFISSETLNNTDIKTRPVFYDGDEQISLTSDEGRFRFANWVVEKFLPKIKEEHKGNEFVQDLIVDDKMDTLWNQKFKFMHLRMDATNAKSEEQIGYADSYLYNLQLLHESADTDGNGDIAERRNNIFNVLFWYNLVINKNNITKNSYASLLGNILLKPNDINNPYRRLLTLKGKIGKVVDVDLGMGKDLMLKSNGIEFDLINLLANFELHTDIIYERGEESSWDADDVDAMSDVSGDEDYDNEPDDVSEPDDDFGDDQVDFDDIDDEEGGRATKKSKLIVTRKRTRGETGTTTTIERGKTTAKDYKLIATIVSNVPSMIMAHSSNRRSKYLGSVDYDPTEMVGLAVNEKDTVNYQRLMTMSMHELLTNILGDKRADNETYDIQILRSDGSSEQFDPNKDYTCL